MTLCMWLIRVVRMCASIDEDINFTHIVKSVTWIIALKALTAECL